MNPTSILDAAMWLTALAGLAVAVGQIWELLRMKSAGAEAYETGMPNLNQTAKLDTDLANLMELRANYLRRSIRSRRHLVDAKAYRISIKYEHGFFEFEVLLPSNRVVDHWKWSEAQLAAQVEQGPTKAKDSPEIAEARRAIVRDLAGKLGLMHG